MNIATDPRRPFVYGSTARAFWASRDPETVLVGPAGTGKSRCAMELIHQLAQKYEGSRHAMVRATRKSMTESTLVIWETEVVPAGHPCISGAQRRMRQSYVYPNDSAVVIQGMDEPIMGGPYDTVYFEEATETREDAWELWSTRLRHGRMPYSRQIATCNPGPPSHWILQRAKAGRLTLLESRHEDNPRMWDGKAWTQYGLSYLAKLDALTGARRERLRYGRWTQAEGQVYDLWDPSVHVVDRRELPREWRRIWVVDFGYVNPFVCQCWAVDDDGRLWLEWELYRTKRLVEDHARDIKRRIGVSPSAEIPAALRPSVIVCDHDAEDRATLERHTGIPTVAAVKTVSDGLQAVSGRLKVQEDGKPRLMLLRDALVERDEDLRDAKKPQSTEEEFDGYVWDLGAGRKAKDAPLKVDDHGMDAMRYAVMYLERPAAGMAVVEVADPARGRYHADHDDEDGDWYRRQG